MNDLNVVSVAELAGNDMLIASLLNGIESVFDKDVEMAAIEDNLFFSQVVVGDDAWTDHSHMSSSLHCVEAECLHDVAEFGNGTIYVVWFPLDLPCARVAGGLKFIGELSPGSHSTVISRFALASRKVSRLGQHVKLRQGVLDNREVAAAGSIIVLCLVGKK